MRAIIFVVNLFLQLMCINTQNPGNSLKKQGRLCEVNICKSGCLCVVVEEMDSINETCICSMLDSGALCDNSRVGLVHADICMSMPCMNSGTCISQGCKYTCKCPAGFIGNNCEKNKNCHDLCVHAVNCHNNSGAYHCECEPGWSGSRCDQHSNDNESYDLGHFCELNTCLNGGTCTSFNKPGVHNLCDCPPGFTGEICEINIDECISNPCLNGGTCHNLINGFNCTCNNNYTGTYCQTPFDPCANSSRSCKSNDNCHEPTSSAHDYYCLCPQGENCDTTHKCSSVQCRTVKTCKDGIATYKCHCPRGFNEGYCSMYKNYCKHNPCKNKSNCAHNIHDGFTCICEYGFEGVFCEKDINECENSKDICHNGVCVNKKGTYECYCKPGYAGDNCDLNLDECLSLPCLNGASCEDKINGYNCICPNGYSGKNCSIDEDECISNPCLNGATCRNEIGSFKCSCSDGFGGKLCEINIDDCTSSSCQNMGLCIDGIHSYRCNCANTGFEGNQCEIKINYCLYNPCNNGTCIDEKNDYSCNCSIGYTGKNCEIYLNECSSNPCQHGSTCIEHYDPLFNNHTNKTNASITFQEEWNYKMTTEVIKFECLCSPGTTGVKCETILTHTDSSTGHLILLVFAIVGIGSLIAFIIVIKRTNIVRFKLNFFNYFQPDQEMVRLPRAAEPERLI